MEKKPLEKALAFCHTFLLQKQPILYGKRAVRFDLESHYVDFDGMLKREIVYCRFDVRERLAECRILLSGSSLQIHFEHGPSIASLRVDPAMAETFSSLLLHGGYLALTPTLTHRLVLPGYEGDVVLVNGAQGESSLSAPALQPRFVTSSDNSSRTVEHELEDWLRQALVEWVGRTPECRIDVERVTSRGGNKTVVSVWRRVSQVDIDLSGEDVPDVFRWQEATRFGQARSADLSEQECLAILQENKIGLPQDARITGISTFEVDDDSSCTALRYGHYLPDPASEKDSGGEVYRNRGYIVVEGDFWEFHLDAKDRMLIGEYRKWRRTSTE